MSRKMKLFFFTTLSKQHKNQIGKSEKGVKLIPPNTQSNVRSFSWLGAGTLIKLLKTSMVFMRDNNKYIDLSESFQ